MSAAISALVVSGGALVLSGILAEQADSVIAAYQENINFNTPVQQEDWIRLDGISNAQ
jgi:ribosomal protein L11 methyltransferase